MFRKYRGFSFCLAIFALLLPIFIDVGGESLSFAGEIALGIFLMAAVLWISEAVPIWSTSLLVIFLQVLLLSDQSLLLDAENLSGYQPKSYREFYSMLAHPIIILFLGGFYLAGAAVKYGLDKNLTKAMLSLFGRKPSWVLLGLLLSTGLLSAFMSNTATSAMMITVILPIMARLKADDPFRIGLALAIPCGANIGGVATPIGTPPNAVVLGALAKQGVQIGFAEWMLLAVPLVLLMLLVAWRALLILFPPRTPRIEVAFDEGWNTSPLAVGSYLIFGLTVLLWVTDSLHGISSTIIAFLPIAGMSLLGIITKSDLKNFSWDVLWLVAGGLSLGLTMNFEGGPAPWLIGLINWSLLPALLIILGMALAGYVLSNLISNTVAATILIPIAITMGATGAVDPGFNLNLACVVIGIMVSFSMLLPISTPPNAIAMSTGLIETRHLTRVGIFIGIIGYVLIGIFAVAVWPFLAPGLFQTP